MPTDPQRSSLGSTRITGERRLDPPELEQAVARALVLAFAPLHKRIFGIAIGTAVAALIAAVTLITVIVDPQDSIGLQILHFYFRGYTVSWQGIVIGAAWGFAVGFIGGWFVAFCRNFFLATWLLYIRVRANLMQTRDFLDHI